MFGKISLSNERVPVDHYSLLRKVREKEQIKLMLTHSLTKPQSKAFLTLIVFSAVY